MTLAVLAVPGPAAYAGNKATPRNFTGYGFDQCLTPTQEKMDVWLEYSPFLAVGIYISGDSRACRDQPNLTPTWVATQLQKGWRLLPITLGPQASCLDRFPRYADDEVIDDDPGVDGQYRNARLQGRAEAVKAVAAAQALGIVPGSTLWYDLEGFDDNQTDCRESALGFISGWSLRLRQLGYVSGVYSSAGSGIEMLDKARVERPGDFVLPEYLWIARWDLLANTSTSYISEEGWNPHRRIKQYQGGHDETWGGVTINIDRNFLDVGKGSVAAPERHCRSVQIDFPTYRALKVGKKRPYYALALKCLLKERGYYKGKLRYGYGPGIVRAVNRWQAKHDFAVHPTFSRRNWIGLLSQGKMPVLKFGSAGKLVRRVQRSMNAAKFGPLEITGVYDVPTVRAVRAWQKSVGVPVTGVIAPASWAALHSGRR
ncbi:MAG: glycoside hydrolase domain-containing protein [Nocardioides sp.]